MKRAAAIFLLSALALAAPNPPLQFRIHTVATGLKGGYQVVPFDVNHDGKIDLIALASGMTDLVWYENPGWERHVIASNLPHMINLAVRDADGQPQIGLAYEFANEASKSIGIVAILDPSGDVRQPWTVREIDRLPTSHRLRWMQIDESGPPVLVNAPLTGATAKPPDFREHVPLVFYRPGKWKRELLSEANQGVQHGVAVVNSPGTRIQAIFTASFSGIDFYESDAARQTWNRTEITRGDPAPWPKCGSSDIAPGKTKNDKLLAAIEPWHGNQVVVYRPALHGSWLREVIDDSLVDGHTIVTADFDHDGNDEIVAGFRGQPHNVYLYRFDGKRWNRQTLDDGGMAAAACAVADLNGDGRPDLTCIGSATQNLAWYENSKQ